MYKNKVRVKTKISKDKFLIKPTTEARVDFISELIPKWMKQFEDNDWEVAQRLTEEVNENFQFTEDGLNGLRYKDVSLCHIIVQQELSLRKLMELHVSLQRPKRNRNKSKNGK